MARKTKTQSKMLNRLQGAARAMKQLFTRDQDEVTETRSASSAPAVSTAAETSSATARTTKRVAADIPHDLIEAKYSPSSTSSKASFRSDGRDHQSDQEFALGMTDDRWNDEDRLTNKSGDPRIGTHRRTYEPGEAVADSRE